MERRWCFVCTPATIKYNNEQEKRCHWTGKRQTVPCLCEPCQYFTATNTECADASCVCVYVEFVLYGTVRYVLCSESTDEAPHVLTKNIDEIIEKIKWIKK